MVSELLLAYYYFLLLINTHLLCYTKYFMAAE